jgi:multicomponent Na+:H+ antiporter subunit A
VVGTGDGFWWRVEQGDSTAASPTTFEIASWPEAFGRNIVNVILVDFRALDTFGEIAVVVIAALAAYALLRGTRYTRTATAGEDD